MKHLRNTYETPKKHLSTYMLYLKIIIKFIIHQYICLLHVSFTTWIFFWRFIKFNIFILRAPPFIYIFFKAYCCDIKLFKSASVVKLLTVSVFRFKQGFHCLGGFSVWCFHSLLISEKKQAKTLYLTFDSRKRKQSILKTTTHTKNSEFKKNFYSYLSGRFHETIDDACAKIECGKLYVKQKKIKESAVGCFQKSPFNIYSATYFIFYKRVTDVRSLYCICHSWALAD